MAYYENMTENLKTAMEIANQITTNLSATYIGSEHLLFGFLKTENCSAYKLLTECGVNPSEYERVFLNSIDPNYAPQGMTTRTVQMFKNAMRFSDQTKTLTGTSHFLLAVLDSESCMAVKILKSLGVDINLLRTKTHAELCRQKSQANGAPTPAPTLSNESQDWNRSMSVEWEREARERAERTEREQAKRKEEEERQARVSAKLKQVSFNQPQEQKSPNKMLAYGTDLTERARQGKIDPVIGRKKEIEKLTQVLSRRSKNNPVLIGEPGVGKSAIVEGLAKLIVEGNVPEQLINKTLFSVDLPDMIAGARYRGDFEERLKDLIETVTKEGDILLFIDEIHGIVGAGASTENNMDAANILKPLLARGDLQVIGATTIEEYRKYIEKDGALERRFTPVQVDEPKEQDAIAILKGLRAKYEEHHGLVIMDEAIEAAVQLSTRYITDRFLPDKAIDLIDEAAARVRLTEVESAEISDLKAELESVKDKIEMHKSRREYSLAQELLSVYAEIEKKIYLLKKAQAPVRLSDGRLALGREQVASIISSRMKIPLTQITQEEGEKLMRLEEELHKRIIGQEEGVSAVAKAIRRARAGLKDPSRPIGSFIFVGPTGVGKTDLCKALSEALFGSEEQMIRLDMSEFMEKQAVSKLIGAPPGYVGFEDSTGQLTDKVRTNPYSVVLFDEIEKAHPDVFNLMLQILDDGRLTDSKGRTVDFKNTVIILTSNVGASVKTEKTGVYGFGSDVEDKATDEAQYERMKSDITAALKEKFRPEFLNRLDEVVVFRRLTEQNLAKIAEKMIDGLSKRLVEQRQIALVVTSSALKKLVEEGYDSQYGARPLKRVIQRRIQDKLSEEILRGNIRNGQKVTLDFMNGEFVFTSY